MVVLYVLNAYVIIAVGKDIIMGKDSNLLHSNGGSLVIVQGISLTLSP